VTATKTAPPTPPPTPKLTTPDELLKAIDSGLAILGLGEVRRALEETLAQPTPDEGRLAWLWRLVEPQVRRRVENRVERRFCDSRLPEKKTLAGFNFAFQPKLDRDLVMELATLRFIDQGKNVLLAGMSGTGKSHIAMALGLLACGANRWVTYTTSADMLTRLTRSLADDTLGQALRPFTRADLLIIDEVGLEQVERDGARRSGLMQKVLLPRYNDQRATVITSNIPWEAWGEYLDDHLGATALIDRLLHRSHVIVINGPSYREWEHKKETAAPRSDDKVMHEAATTPAKRRAPATSAGDRRRGK
jgi:DNA replication protein DnaC